MKKVKITVVKRCFNEELAAEYANPELGKCQKLEEGQVFYAAWKKPEGFCDEAWKAIHHYVMLLSHGGSRFFNGRWMKQDNMCIASCNDGIRPTIFKIEALDEEMDE